MTTLIERRRQAAMQVKGAIMRSYEDMLHEIKNFQPWRGPELAPGVAGHLHAPELCFHISYTNSAEHKSRSVDCLCGAKLDYDGIPVPINQPCPWLYVGLEAFKCHLAEVKELANADAALVQAFQTADDWLNHAAHATPSLGCHLCKELEQMRVTHYELSTGELS